MTTAPANDVIVAVCTYNRTAELDRLLRAIDTYARDQWKSCTIGVTVIDDSADGNARAVAARYADRFALGLVYENSASRNISVARNLAVARSIDRASFIAMTDDDCEPSDLWLTELLRVRAASGAEVSTGLMLRKAPAHAPRWIQDQPFLQLGEFHAVDGEELPIANTNNSLIATAFLRERPALRFDPAFGRTGGEDMAFFHAMKQAGARIVYAARAFVYEIEPDERLTLRYQFRRHLWQGNTSVVTRLPRGVGRLRLTINGGATMVRGAIRPLRQLSRREPPQFLFAAAKMVEGVGIMLGVIGIRLKHK